MTLTTIDPQEQERLCHMLIYEEAAYLQGYSNIAGIDEAGRGPLAGPVVAAACILPRGSSIPYIDDSKKLTPKIRQQLFERLTTDPAIRYGVGIIDPETIDRINILQATILAMLQAVEKLDISPDYLLVDGLKLPHPHISVQKIIKGDQLSQSIAAASIIAKETRDMIMRAYDEQWPQYGFAKHKGYGTAKHLDAINAHGPCAIHRLSFAPFTICGVN